MALRAGQQAGFDRLLPLGVAGDATDVYQTDYSGTAMDVAPAGKAEATASLFVGAKELNLLNTYRDEFAGAGIPLFDRAVDFSGYLGYSSRSSPSRCSSSSTSSTTSWSTISASPS